MREEGWLAGTAFWLFLLLVERCFLFFFFLLSPFVCFYNLKHKQKGGTPSWLSFRRIKVVAWRPLTTTMMNLFCLKMEPFRSNTGFGFDTYSRGCWCFSDDIHQCILGHFFVGSSRFHFCACLLFAPEKELHRPSLAKFLRSGQTIASHWRTQPRSYRIRSMVAMCDTFPFLWVRFLPVR